MDHEQDQWIQAACWEEILKKIPIPCVDVIVHRDREFLMGWRSIPPYKNVWALIGGRILRGESFEAAAVRHCMKSGIRISNVRQLGVFPVVFRSRHDITISLAAKIRSGIPKPTREMTRYRWFKKSELSKISSVGENYNKMLRHWVLIDDHSP
jgi:ADP-ribose pyrophosphatase YjhB (NUDIX family)